MILSGTKLISCFSVKDDTNKENIQDLVYFIKFISTNALVKTQSHVSLHTV